jgi:hypothetical protein
MIHSAWGRCASPALRLYPVSITAWQCCLCHQIDWITGARQSYCIPPLLIFQQIYRHPQRDGFQTIHPSTDHIANIVSESQAWKICRHHQLTLWSASLGSDHCSF